MSGFAGQAELHTFSLIKNLHRLVRSPPRTRPQAAHERRIMRGGRADHDCAAPARELDGENADGARRVVHQDALPGRNVGPLDKSLPSRERRDWRYGRPEVVNGTRLRGDL